jgi:alpha-D-ribose 1-methylphosphonate 5-triphosphate synthase subunit PhnH
VLLTDKAGVVYVPPVPKSPKVVEGLSYHCGIPDVPHIAESDIEFVTQTVAVVGFKLGDPGVRLTVNEVD